MTFFKREIHASWIITAGFFGVLFGIGFSLVLYIGVIPGWILATLVILLLVLSLRQHKIWCVLPALFAGLIIGLARGGTERVVLNVYGDFIGQDVTVTGKVSEDPDFGLSGDLRVKLSHVQIDGIELPATVWASAISGPLKQVKRSDIVSVSGNLKIGFANFPASISFGKLTHITRGDQDDLARDLRDSFGEKLREVIKAPEADLGMGILAGQKRALPNLLSEAFMAAGLTHIIVASGYNLTILVRFARRLFAKISRFAATSGAIILVLIFASVTGFGPSMIRACLVTMLSLFCWYVGRKMHPVTLLCIVAGITALINPYFVWGDAGWYMSFGAFAGVIIVSPLLQNYFWGDKKPSWFRQIFIDTMCASLITMPVIAFFIGNFAPFGLLANLLVLPIVPFTMLLTFLASIFAIILPFAAVVLALPAGWLLSYIIKVAETVASFPGALNQVEFPAWALGASYALSVLVVLYMWRKTKFNFRNDYLVK
ncbi:ComEC/Rec2 family competence protein [Candidatus Saccharibacteria bacterium]|nr:ComEC/Rec2 family competence protein [Candidatus Saccharibacteria bacterium]